MQLTCNETVVVVVVIIKKKKLQYLNFKIYMYIEITRTNIDRSLNI